MEDCPGKTGIGKEVPVKRELDNLITLEVLSGHRGNQCKASKELGVHRNTLSRILNELNIDPAQVRTGLRRPPRSERGPVDANRQRGERA